MSSLGTLGSDFSLVCSLIFRTYLKIVIITVSCSDCYSSSSVDISQSGDSEYNIVKQKIQNQN
jgi:hypothetical protein